MRTNPILNTDSYKASHYLQYPPGTEHVYSYVESRGGAWDRTLFFGLQAFLMEDLSDKVTPADIIEAEALLEGHGLPFNRAGWEYIVAEHGGHLPLSIRAIAEGTVLPTGNALCTVVNTDPKCFWLTSHIETALLRAIWYPTTVATNSYMCKQVIRRYLEETSDDAAGQLPFKLHDFGARGVSSLESAALGGAAHLVNFRGTDTLAGIMAAREYYGEPMAGFSIPAAEHSTITSWGRAFEGAAYENMVDRFAKPGATLAVVSDSYDIYGAICSLWGSDRLSQKILASGATVVIRPDSGNPAEVVLSCVTLLGERFGRTLNNKGYKVLNPAVRVIQGDGININSMETILRTLKQEGWSAENVAFGMGGGLLQQLDRDTLKFAMKCSAVQVMGGWREVYKDPITDHGKRSKRGRLAVITEDGRWATVQADGNAWRDELHEVYRNGSMLRETSFQEIRDRSEMPMLGDVALAQAAQ